MLERMSYQTLLNIQSNFSVSIVSSLWPNLYFLWPKLLHKTILYSRFSLNIFLFFLMICLKWQKNIYSSDYFFVFYIINLKCNSSEINFTSDTIFSRIKISKYISFLCLFFSWWNVTKGKKYAWSSFYFFLNTIESQFK